LPGEVWEIELVADQDVAFAERVVAFGGLEALFDVEVQIETDVVETAGASALGSGVDGSLHFDPGADATEAERHPNRSGKSKRCEVGEFEGLPHVEFAAGMKDAADVDVRARPLHCRSCFHVPVAKRAAARAVAYGRRPRGQPRNNTFDPNPLSTRAVAAMGGRMNLTGIRYGAEITAAARAHGLDPALLAAVAAQETGGPGSNSGRNVVGDCGHGHGLFQIDDRSWAFAKTPAAMDPAKNADAAAAILRDDLTRYGGNVTEALSAYNSGLPTATGTPTTWPDGATLGYAASVLRHEAAIVAAPGGELAAEQQQTSAGVNALAALGAAQPVPAASSGAGSLPPLPPLALPSAPAPPTPIPAGSQAQAAQNVGAQADHDEAAILDQVDVFGGPDGADG